jgi:hypothetical protein
MTIEFDPSDAAMTPNNRQMARAGYWLMTPHKIPARIAFIRELTSKNEQLFVLNVEHAVKVEQLGKQNAELAAKNAELAAKVDQLSKRSAMDRSLVFMHIPKTSGTALMEGLREVLPSPDYIAGFDRSFFGAFRSFETLSLEMRNATIEALPPANHFDFVTGHKSYSTLIQSRPASRFMTVLREPRVRIVSLWMFWRSCSDEIVSPFGAWARVIRMARQPLVEFLNCPEAACQTDNIYVRMLLSPHPLIPDDGFIDSASDERLAREAAARLKTFDFVDVIENPGFEDNLRAFLARPFVYRRANENPPMPSEFRAPLDDELTDDVLTLVEHRSRIDRELWRAVATERIAEVGPTTLSDDTFRRTIARYAALMTPG